MRARMLTILVAVLLGLTSCRTVSPRGRPPVEPAAAPPPAAAEPAPAAAPEKLSNTLKWSTASEVDNFGFDVYRGDGPEGPFERLSSSPVQGAGTSDLPHRYEFEDRTIEAGREYYYFIESISIHGVRERFTPVVKVAAKGAPGVAPESSGKERE